MSSALIKNINYLLKEKNVTRNAVAKSAGLTPSTLGRLLDEENYSGRRPREKTVAEIAKFFEVSPADLESDPEGSHGLDSGNAQTGGRTSMGQSW